MQHAVVLNQKEVERLRGYVARLEAFLAERLGEPRRRRRPKAAKVERSARPRVPKGVAPKAQQPPAA